MLSELKSGGARPFLLQTGAPPASPTFKFVSAPPFQPLVVEKCLAVSFRNKKVFSKYRFKLRLNTQLNIYLWWKMHLIVSTEDEYNGSKFLTTTYTLFSIMHFPYRD